MITKHTNPKQILKELIEDYHYVGARISDDIYSKRNRMGLYAPTEGTYITPNKNHFRWLYDDEIKSAYLACFIIDESYGHSYFMDVFVMSSLYEGEPTFIHYRSHVMERICERNNIKPKKLYDILYLLLKADFANTFTVTSPRDKYKNDEYTARTSLGVLKGAVKKYEDITYYEINTIIREETMTHKKQNIIEQSLSTTGEDLRNFIKEKTPEYLEQCAML